MIMILLKKNHLTNPIAPKPKFLLTMDTPSGREGQTPLENKKLFFNKREETLSPLETLTFVLYVIESLILNKL